MNFLLYFILRELFVKLRFSDKEISLEKGLLLKRLSVMPLSAVVRITSRRTLFLRLFHAKEVEVFTLGGKMRFFLSRNEKLPFLPDKRTVVSRPRFRDVMLGAFIDTRALGGLFVFAAVLRKISAIFGSEYLDYIVSALSQTAEELEKALGFFRVAVPKIAVTLAVFALGAWTFAYARKLARLARLRLSEGGGFLFAESGIVTLYEHALVPNSAVIRCDTVTTLLTRKAPLYIWNVMICPGAKLTKLPKHRLSSPKRAFLGHIAVPLTEIFLFSLALGAVYLADVSAMLLKTILYSGIIVNLYAAVLYILYMYRSGVFFGEKRVLVSARRGLRLYTAAFTREIVTLEKVSQSVFQRFSKRCNYKLSIAERKNFTVRQVSRKEVSRRSAFYRAD